MKTLVEGQYYEITDDTEIVYEGEIIPISDDGYGNWGFIYNEKFTPLTAFQVDGVNWFFTNDFQEVAIREFVGDVFSSTDLELDEIEWFKTYVAPDDESNVVVYYKIRGKESYRSLDHEVNTEQDLMDLFEADLES
ncbi:hypothetical protein SNE25_24545 [Mucilaginibacter sabulilitoris]|uniref:DUF4178 domain-containing protein n=1 Tax=Mucilaginibacter sabulilitoris TaxID=1173583 RepID=A0ABZ0TH33_9SPHI|nr:hypothetical protein [Mucilaginibacter sabulilitoris]WPU92501.1 hypothetical protein SNE25_24545 [Mucilaginibacter sabulilitoris]